MVLMALRLVHPKDKNSYEDLFQRASGLATELSMSRWRVGLPSTRT